MKYGANAFLVQIGYNTYFVLSDGITVIIITISFFFMLYEFSKQHSAVSLLVVPWPNIGLMFQTVSAVFVPV